MLEVSIPTAYELLAQCIKQGQALVQRASLVGDFSDYESWKAARKQWIDPTANALTHMYDGPREARDFAETVTCRDSGKRWQDQYAADLDCVKRAIDLITLLQGELAFDAQRLAAPNEPAAGESPAEDDLPALEPLAHENELSEPESPSYEQPDSSSEPSMQPEARAAAPMPNAAADMREIDRAE